MKNLLVILVLCFVVFLGVTLSAKQTSGPKKNTDCNGNSQSLILLTPYFDNLLKIGGEDACFIVDDNPSTGYRWEVGIDNSGVYILKQTITMHPSVDAVGAPSKIEWIFSAAKVGKGKIVFKQFAPGQESPSKEITIKVIVRR
ncbi:MAG: protease inhibitor I42 family protein [Candidatus Omnitrophota bacterium]